MNLNSRINTLIMRGLSAKQAISQALREEARSRRRQAEFDEAMAYGERVQKVLDAR
jgi:hypothetical protein